VSQAETEHKAAEPELRDFNAHPEAAVEARTRNLQASLNQQASLLHEVGHRANNNLQLISSLMLLQSRQTDDPAVAEALKRMQQRLSALSIAHRLLFQTTEAGQCDMAALIGELARDLAAAEPELKIALDLDLEPVKAPAAQAAAIALLLGDLIDHAFRQARLTGRERSVRINLRRGEDGAVIEIADDGTGMSEPPAGFRMTIVTLLSRQLSATVGFAQRPREIARIDLPLAPAAGG